MRSSIRSPRCPRRELLPHFLELELAPASRAVSALCITGRRGRGRSVAQGSDELGLIRRLIRRAGIIQPTIDNTSWGHSVGELRDELGIIARSVASFESLAPHLRHPGPIINGEPVQVGAPKGAFVDALPLGIASWAPAASEEAFRLSLERR